MTVVSYTVVEYRLAAVSLSGTDTWCNLSYYLPDPKDDITINLDGKTVHVPQGKPIHMPQYSVSSFSQSEYLVYKESQARIRYLLKLKF